MRRTDAFPWYRQRVEPCVSLQAPRVALGDGALGDEALGDEALGDGALGDGALGDGALGDVALGDWGAWRRGRLGLLHLLACCR